MKNVNEIWKDVVGFEGKYQVSNLGNVKSLNYHNSGKEKLMKSHDNGRGYLYVMLWKNGEYKHKKVHRLVAEAFIDNPYNLPEINHKDEDKTNNRVENLEWCTHEYNCNFGTRNERVGKKTAERLSKPVLCVETGFLFDSTHDAERKTGIFQQNISKCCKGKRKTAGSFHWRYADEKEGVLNA